MAATPAADVRSWWAWSSSQVGPPTNLSQKAHEVATLTVRGLTPPVGSPPWQTAVLEEGIEGTEGLMFERRSRSDANGGGFTIAGPG